MFTPVTTCLSISLVLAFLLSSCRMPTSPPESQFIPPLSAQETATLSTKTVPTSPTSEPEFTQVTAPPASAVQVTGLPVSGIQVLPGAVYFLNADPPGDTQVWRLAADGSTLTQITHQPSPAEIGDFDVSPRDGKVAYTEGKRLMLQGFPQEAPTLLFDGGLQNPNQYLQALRWSPDGSKLAFGFGGVWIYSLSSGKIQLSLPDVYQSGGLLVVQYLPVSWSPESQRLLVSLNRENSSTLGILSFDPLRLITLSQGPACCQVSWAPDGSRFLVANPFSAVAETGLWQYDAMTGQGNPLITARSPDLTYNLIGWPFLGKDNRLAYFFGNYPSLPQEELPLQPVYATLDKPQERIPMRAESSFVREVLWSADGDSAVLVLPPPGAISKSSGGPVVYVHQDGRPAQPLIPNGYALHWGP